MSTSSSLPSSRSRHVGTNVGVDMEAEEEDGAQDRDILRNVGDYAQLSPEDVNRIIQVCLTRINDLLGLSRKNKTVGMISESNRLRTRALLLRRDLKNFANNIRSMRRLVVLRRQLAWFQNMCGSSTSTVDNRLDLGDNSAKAIFIDLCKELADKTIHEINKEESHRNSKFCAGYLDIEEESSVGNDGHEGNDSQESDHFVSWGSPADTAALRESYNDVLNEHNEEELVSDEFVSQVAHQLRYRETMVLVQKLLVGNSRESIIKYTQHRLAYIKTNSTPLNRANQAPMDDQLTGEIEGENLKAIKVSSTSVSALPRSPSDREISTSNSVVSPDGANVGNSLTPDQAVAAALRRKHRKKANLRRRKLGSAAISSPNGKSDAPALDSSGKECVLLTGSECSDWALGEMHKLLRGRSPTEMPIEELSNILATAITEDIMEQEMLDDTTESSISIDGSRSRGAKDQDFNLLVEEEMRLSAMFRERYGTPIIRGDGDAYDVWFDFMKNMLQFSVIVLLLLLILLKCVDRYIENISKELATGSTSGGSSGAW